MADSSRWRTVAHERTLGFLSTSRSPSDTSSPVEDLSALLDYDLVLLRSDAATTATNRRATIFGAYNRSLSSFRYGPGVFKVDYALNAPIPGTAAECQRAATVHLGGSFEDIAESEKMVRTGQPAERPFILLAQPSLFDSSRAPAGKHTAWAYCHVPNGSKVDMLQKIEDQIERFAPGFRECVLARHVFSPADLETWTQIS